MGRRSARTSSYCRQNSISGGFFIDRNPNPSFRAGWIMSETVGSLSIELSLDRSRYDRQLNALRNEKGGQLQFAAALDTRALRRQIDNLSRATPTINVAAKIGNLNALEGQLKTFTRSRTIDIGVRLDDRSIDQQMRSLTQSRIVRLQAAVINSNAIERQISDLTRDRTVRIGFEIDDRKLSKFTDKSFKVTAQVDDRQLTALNKHLDLKQKHFTQVNNYFSSRPLTPRVDLSQLDQLGKRLDEFKNTALDIRVNVADLRAQLSAIEVPVTIRSANTQAKPITQEIKSDTREFEKNITNSVERAFKQVKGGNLLSGIGSIASIPLKVAGSALSGAAGSIASGLTLGITQPITQNLGKGISGAIELAISNSVGSSELFAQKAAQVLGASLQKGLTQGLDNLPELVSSQITKLGDELNLPAGVTKKIGRQLKRGLEEQIKELRTLSKDVSQVATAIVGDEGAEEGLAVRGRAKQKSRARRSGALKQSIEEQRNAVDSQSALDQNLSTLSRQSAQDRGKFEQLYKQLQQRVNQLKDQIAVAQSKGDNQQLASLLADLQATTGKLSSVGGDLELLRTFNPKRVERARTRRDRVQSELELKRTEQAQAQAAYTANPNDKSAIDRFGELSAEITELENNLKSLNKSLEIVDSPKQRAQERVGQSIDRTQGLQASVNREANRSKAIEALQKQEASLVKAAANFRAALEKASSELLAAQQSGDVDAAVTAFKRRKVVEAQLKQTESELAPIQEQMRLKAVPSIAERVAPKPAPVQPVALQPKPEVKPEVQAQPKPQAPQVKAENIPDPWTESDSSAMVRSAKPEQKAEEKRKGLDVTVNMDKLADAAYQAGMAVNAVTTTAKKTASVFRQIANSEAAQNLAAGMGNAARGLFAVGKATYQLATIAESVALDMVPMGRTAKGVLKQTAVPAMAFGAATHFLPGGGMVAESMNHLAQGALSPLMHMGGDAMSSQATGMISQAVPKMFGMQAQVTGAVTGMIQSAVESAIAPIAQAATAIVGGSVITGAAGNALKPVASQASNLALPAAKSPALPAATVAALPAAQGTTELVENPFEGLTRPQLLSASRKLGIQGVNTKTTKDDLLNRLQSYSNQSEVDRVLGEVRSEIGKDGKPIAGFDKKAESEAIKRLSKAEKDLNKKITQLGSATGAKREKLINEILQGTQDAIAEIDQLKGQNFSGETIRSLSGIQGRLENSYRNNPTLNDARNERINTARSAAIQSANQRNITGLARVTAPAEAETATLGKTLKEGVRKLTNFAAKQFDVIPQPTIKGTLGAIAQSPKARDLATDLAVNTAGFAASKLGEQYGVVPGLAGDLIGALAMRQAISRGRPSAKDLTGDIAGFGIGNGFATAANAGLDALSGVVPGAGLLRSIPFKGAIAAMATVPKVTQAAEKFQNPEGLARVGSSTDGLLSKFKGLFSGNQRKADRLSANYEAIYGQTAALSGAAFDPKNMPKISVDPKRLKQMGAEAFYDIEQNTIVIDQTLARILSGRASELKRNAEKLKGLVHEGRHSVQLDQGRLTLEQAATGQNVPLYGDRYLSKQQRSQVAASVEIARKSGASASQLDASKVLETDAYAFEANTQNILARVSGDGGGLFKGLLDRFRGVFSKSNNTQQIDRAIAQAEAAKANVEAQLANFDQLEKALTAKSAELQRRNDQEEAFKQLDNDAELNNLKKTRRSFTPEERKRFAGLQREVNRSSPIDGLSGLSQEVTAATAKISEATKSSNLFGRALGNLGGLAKTAIAGFIGFTVLSNIIPVIQNFASESLKAAIALERVKTSLNFSTGGKGSEALAFVKGESDRLGLSLSAAQAGYSQLSASTRGTLSARDTQELFKGLNDASASFGLTDEQYSGSVLALSQISSKGKLSAEELRGQLAERIPGAFGVAAKSLGISEAELNKQLELGAISSQDFLPRFSRQLQIEYGGSAKSSSDNTQAGLNRLNTSVTQAQQALGAMFTPAVSTGAKTLAGLIDLVAKNLDKIIIAAGVFGSAFVAPMAKAALSLGLVQKGLGLAAAGAGAVKAQFATLATQFIAVTAAMEGIRAIGEIFSLSDKAKQFESFADSGERSLKRIEEAAKRARGEVSQIPDGKQPKLESQGFDLTLGVGNALGFGTIKTDDILNQVNIGKEKLNRAFGRDPNEGKFTTVAELNRQREDERVARFASSNDALLGTGFDKSGEFKGQLAQASQIDREVASKQSERARLAAQPRTDRQAIAKVEADIKALTSRRSDVLSQFTEYQAGLQGNISTTKTALERQDLDPNQRKNLESQLKLLEQAQAAAAQLERSFGTPADRVKELRQALTELSIGLDEVQRRSDIKFNVQTTKDVNDQIAALDTDANASLNAGVKSAQRQANRTQEQFKGNQELLDSIAPKLNAPEVQQRLSGIVDTNTGKSVSVDSSIAELEKAKIGKDDLTKQDLDNLIAYKKALDGQKALEAQAAQDRLSIRQAEFDRKMALLEKEQQKRELANRKSINAEQVGLINRRKDKSITEEDAAIESAKLSSKQTGLEADSTQKQLEALKAAKAARQISEEQFQQKRIELEGKASDLAVQKAQSELAIREAIDQKKIKLIQNGVDAQRRASDANIAALDRERIAIESTIAQMDRKLKANELDQQLAQATSGLRQTVLKGGLDRSSEASELQKQLTTGNIGQNEKAVVQSQLGELGFNGADQVSILQQRQALQAEIDQERIAALQKQQELEKQSLALSFEKEKQQARINLLEKQNAVLKAEQNVLQAKGDLQKAQLSGDTNQIANAQSMVDINQKILDGTRQQAAIQSEINGSLDQEAAKRQQLADLQQQAARETLQQEANANRRRGQLDVARAMDQAGNGASVGGSFLNTGTLNTGTISGGQAIGAGKGINLRGDGEIGAYDRGSRAIKDAISNNAYQGQAGQREAVLRALQLTSGKDREFAMATASQSGYSDIVNALSRIDNAQSGASPSVSRSIDSALMSAQFSGDVVDAITKLGDRIDNLASRPSNVSFSTPDPVSDYANYLNQRAGSTLRGL